MARVVLVASLLLLAASACASEVEPGAGPLTTLSGWSEVDPSVDPYDDRPEGASCDPYAWGPEDGVLEVRTQICDYLTLSQGMLREVHAGETIVVDVWNLGLWASPPTQGHVSVEVGGARWEAWPPIPSPADRWEATFEVEDPLPAGTPIYLHLHNHGVNSWRFAPPRTR